MLYKLAMVGSSTHGTAASPGGQGHCTDSNATQHPTGKITEGKPCSEPAQRCVMHESCSAADAPAGPAVCGDSAAGVTRLDQQRKPHPAQLKGWVDFDGSGKEQQLEVGTGSLSSGSGRGKGWDQRAGMGQRARHLKGQLAAAPDGSEVDTAWASLAQPGADGRVRWQQWGGMAVGAAAAAVAAVGVWWLWVHFTQ